MRTSVINKPDVSVISEEDRLYLAELRKWILVNYKHSSNTGKIYLTVVNRLEAFRASCVDTPFKSWTTETVENFIIYCDYTSTSIANIMPMLKHLFETVGNSINFKDINKEKIVYSNKNYFYSFDELKKHIDSIVQQTYPENLCNTVNKFTTYRVVLYLIWVGFTEKEIISMKRENFSPVFKAVYSDVKTVSLSEYPKILEAISEYVNADEYVSYSDSKGIRNMKYKDTGYLIKNKGGYYPKRGYQFFSAITKDCNISMDVVYWSGVMSRLEKFEKLGNKISVENKKEISEYLSTNNDSITNENGGTSVTSEAIRRYRYYRYNSAKETISGLSEE